MNLASSYLLPRGHSIQRWSYSPTPRPCLTPVRYDKLDGASPSHHFLLHSADSTRPYHLYLKLFPFARVIAAPCPPAAPPHTTTPFLHPPSVAPSPSPPVDGQTPYHPTRSVSSSSAGREVVWLVGVARQLSRSAPRLACGLFDFLPHRTSLPPHINLTPPLPPSLPPRHASDCRSLRRPSLSSCRCLPADRYEGLAALF